MMYNMRPSERPCPRCGGECVQWDWWDDPPELGGAFLEVVRECTVCDWSTY